jgi:hypothetical protein
LNTFDLARLRRLRALSRLLDEAFRIPGTSIRLGLDSIIGLVPGLGDLLTAALSVYIVREAARMGVPRATLVRMLANVGIDLAAGTIPVVGDLIDVAWKANVMNIDLLEDYLRSQSPQAAPHPARKSPFFWRRQAA